MFALSNGAAGSEKSGDDARKTTRECLAFSPLLRRPSLERSSRVAYTRARCQRARLVLGGRHPLPVSRASAPPTVRITAKNFFMAFFATVGLVVAFCASEIRPATSRPSAPQGDEHLCRSISRTQRGDGVLPSPCRRSPRGRRVRATMEPTRRARASRKASHGTRPKNRPARERGGGLRRRVRRPHGR